MGVQAGKGADDLSINKCQDSKQQRGQAAYPFLQYFNL